MQNEILQVENLSFGYGRKKGFFQRRQILPLLDNIDFKIHKGEALGLWGDSGSGKTTLAKCLLRVIKPQKGQIFFEGENIILSENQRPSLKKEMQIVFQDSLEALNPSWIVYFLLEEPLKIHHPRLNRKERGKRLLELLKAVELSEDILLRLPGELSGGQRQRINIARALAVEPKLLVLDEPVSQLDACVQNAILKLLIKLQEERGLSYLLISHDLRVLSMVCHRILKMEKGRLFSA